ncbi:4-hydroxy-tetrahydrodipicolinate reductase [Lentisphaerota bacterium ZTH]|nr:4-hydroxy-tetrahydrodipicolinate reductase [Lentisphaerota bacterium]WET05519.1 4-hydroxy-tetrahydrodipicolinate reductase [Lentisphaerota bacterium ZTH]
MINVAVIGAAGRMGRRLTANITAADDMTLTGAVEVASCPLLGQDAGTVAGVGEVGVAITDNVAAAVENADAVIDFSTGNVSATAETAIGNGAAVVIGTTALSKEQRAELEVLAGKGGRIVLASNMSVGVNLLFHLCREVAGILGEDYDIEIVEMHHNQKKDAPSGTAVTLGEAVCEGRGLDYDKAVVHGREGIVGARTRNEVGMHAVRGGDVVGDHTVIFATGGERVELTHKASSRDTFAKGALRAVRFLSSAAPGLYNMQDVLKLK